MTKTELLFREYRKSEVISFEELEYCGWTINDYLQYLRICEKIRATCIFIRSVNRKSGIQTNNLDEWKQQCFDIAKDELFGFLSKFFERPLNINWEYNSVWAFAENFVLSPRNKVGERCNLIYASSEDFRHGIESRLNISLNGDYRRIAGDELGKYPLSVLEQEVEKAKELQYENKEPEFPPTSATYYEFQAWASRYERYERIEDLTIDIESLEEEIAKRFIPSEDVLYIYTGSPGCVSNHAPLEAVTALVPELDGGFGKINVAYCAQCRKFYLRFEEYKKYCETHKCLLAKIEFVGIPGKNHHSNYKRKKESLLHLYGYNVNGDSALTEEDRHALLAKLLDNCILSKIEIENHLNMLININGRKFDNSLAVQKWIIDLAFVRNYKIDEQERVRIREVIPASTNLKII